MTRLAENIKKFRKSKGWSQHKLSNEAGLSLTGITKMEQGVTTDPAISTLVKVADALGVVMDDLLGRTVPRFPAK
jgi:transcriptional regulator with XRE-family HTH domain